MVHRDRLSRSLKSTGSDADDLGMKWHRQRADESPFGRQRVAFVLSGGGSLGAMQAGQLQALFEAGITPDLVIGMSAGALNGATIAYQPTLKCGRPTRRRSGAG